jgi:NAD(P)-dependent dehydrogenase (short-subunit alcohol dehydrogenase family)
MSTSLPGVALVTGAGAGIGRACATALAADGFLVAVNDLDQAACASTVDLIRSGGCQAEAFPFDVSDEAAWHSAAREIRSVLGAVTALVHNAAVKASSDPGDGALLDMQLSSWDRTMAVNLRGPMLGTRTILPQMLEERHGSIVMISSISAVRSVPGLATAYTAAKAGLIGLTQTIAVTYGSSGIRCNAIAPGIVLPDDPPNRPGTAAAGTSLAAAGLIGHDGRAGDISSVVAFLAGPKSLFVNGQTLVVDGGISVHLAGVAA